MKCFAIAFNVALLSLGIDAFVVQPKVANSCKATHLCMSKRQNENNFKNIFAAAAVTAAIFGNPFSALADGM